MSASTSSIQITASHGAPYQGFSVTVVPPAGAILQNGVYEGAARYPFQGSGQPGLDVEGPGRGCNTLSGRYELFGLKTDPSGAVLSFTLEFEQHCEGAAAALFGQFLYNATGPAPVAVSIAPGVALKGNAFRSTGWATLSLSQPSASPVSVHYRTADGTAKAGIDYVAEAGLASFAPGSTYVPIAVRTVGNLTATPGSSFKISLLAPANATLGAASAPIAILDPNGPLTVLALNSQQGDFVGQGLTSLQVLPATSFTTRSSAGYAGVQLGAPGNWSLDFAALSGQTLSPGIYSGAQRYPFQPASAPGLSVTGNGRGCNTVTGGFIITHTLQDGLGGLANFAGDFVQNCDGASAGLFGSLRINAVLDQASITDGQLGGTSVSFAVTVNPVRPTPTYLLFVTKDGTAVGCTDYVATISRVTIPAGVRAVQVHVPLIGPPHAGRYFYGSIASPDLPVVWIPFGRMVL